MAADGNIVARVLERGAHLEQGLDRRVVGDELQLAVEVARDLAGADDELLRVIAADAHDDVLRREPDVRLRVEEEISQRVDRIAAVRRDAADGETLHDRVAGERHAEEVLLQIDGGVELDEQQRRQLQRLLARDRAGGEVGFVIGQQILVHAAETHAAPCAQHPMQPVGGHDDERLRPAAAVAAVPQCAVQAVVRAVLTDPSVPQ